ncbi:hypothetical protein DFH28DRAFT_893222, partial [Melampsora americana]
FDKLPGSNKFQCQLCKVAGLTADDCRMVADNDGWRALANEIYVSDAAPAMEIDEADKVDMASWLQALQDQAASPTKIGSEEEDVRPSNWQNFLPHPDNDNHNSIKSEDEQDGIEEIPLCLQNDDSDEVNKWYNFQKKEVNEEL